MRYVTFYGFFGPTSNVTDAGLDASSVEAFAAAIAALPRRQTADVVTLPIARDPAGRPLRFIPLSDLPGERCRD